MTIDKTVLAIDPGTHKCGMALVRRTSPKTAELLWHEVVPTEYVLPKLHEAYVHGGFQLVIVGGATGSSAVVHALREHLPSMGLLVMDETNTTLQARERYWEHNPKRGWRRFIPSSALFPPVPFDDYAALVLAERVLLSAEE
ncbi:pre-16S rRNA-processing nuclease YqgF [bacterium]|nr:MAG: pre-16S rRNA-processing nuclease YqgF [bacterium]